MNISNQSQGFSVYHLVSAGSTNATSVKAAEGRVVGFDVSNVNAAVRYFKLYNKASAPTVGTDVPVVTVLLPISGRAFQFLGGGLFFSLGIAFALTTEATDAGSTGVSASETVVNLFYN